jgi:hypothetical protein
MRKKAIFFLMIGFISSSFRTLPANEGNTSNFNDELNNKIVASDSIKIQASCETLHDFYTSFNSKDLNFDAFKLALTGFNILKNQGKVSNLEILTVFDLSKPSNEERLFVLDLKNRKILSKSLCSHGKNSGEIIATTFSNTPNSYMTSLGFYLTGETYDGKNGYSLKLDGLEANINDNARERGVVIHGADYCSYNFINTEGRLGRSQGCPALPIEKNEKIIQLIKNKTCFFIYSPNKQYHKSSNLINLDQGLVEDFIQELS